MLMLNIPSELRTFSKRHNLKTTTFKFIGDFSKKSCAFLFYAIIPT